MEGFFSEKSDVFSLGVIFLEIISGRKNSHKEENNLNLLAYVSVYTNQCLISNLLALKLTINLVYNRRGNCGMTVRLLL